ncbi:hypothetical protein XELAEV_18006758mg, partial [Xenopus laevis]
MSKANGRTYEKANRKFGKQQDSDTNNTSLSQKPASLRSALSDDYSLIAAEVARLINPVIESSIAKAIDKIQIKITNISEKLSTHDKRFGEIEDVVSQLQDDMIDSSSKLNSIFGDPGEAHTFTSHLEKKNSGNFASVTTSSNIGPPPKDQRWRRYDIPRQTKLSNDLKVTQVQTKSRSRSRSPLPPRSGNLPHS